MKQLAGRIGKGLGLEAAPLGSATAGIKRKFRLEYPPSYDRDDAGVVDLKDGVELELVRFGVPTPAQDYEITSMLRDWAVTAQPLGLDDLTSFEEFAVFKLPVLAVERTLADKLCIVHRLAIERIEGPQRGLGGQVRHYYDIGQALTDQTTLRNLQASPSTIAEYAEVAFNDSHKHRKAPQPRPDAGFATSPSFTDRAFLQMAAEEYDRELSRLRLGPVPAFADVLAAVARNAALL